MTTMVMAVESGSAFRVLRFDRVANEWYSVAECCSWEDAMLVMQGVAVHLRESGW